MANSADPDQLASSEANSSGSTLLRQGMSCSTREGLTDQHVLDLTTRNGVSLSTYGINSLFLNCSLIALDKRGVSDKYFSYFSMKTYVVGIH